jgi:protein SCO1/2
MTSHRLWTIGGALALLATSAIGVVLLLKWQQRESGPSAAAAAYSSASASNDGALPILWAAPDFAYPDQNGYLFSNGDLRGHIWVSDFFFSTCTSICPMMTAKMAGLQKTLADSNMRFVSFSVDPDHDTPAVLKQYATMWKADDRWHFLSTERKKLAATAAGMRVFVQPPDENTPIQHSGLFILTDGNGQVRGVYDSADGVALRRLVRDATRLAGEQVTDSMGENSQDAGADAQEPPAPQSPGAALYAARGCLGCHDQGRVAPPLEGIFGHKVLLSDGRTVTADEAYVRESILDPGAKIVAGYPPVMPSYRDQLTDTELNQMIEYLKQLQPAKTAGAAASTGGAQEPQAIDPVCRMAVSASKDGPHAEFEGRTYYFCSRTCRELFLKDPSRYAGRSH